MYKTDDTLPVQLLRNLKMLIFMHRPTCVNHRCKLLPAFCEYFDENTVTHRRDTRHTENFHTYVGKSATGKRVLKVKGTKLWNNIPTDIQARRQ